MTVRHLSDGNPDGCVFGQSATDPIAFFGATPAARPAAAGQAALTDSTGGTASTTLAAITAGAAYAQADLTAIKNAIASLARAVNAINSTLNTLGLQKGSA
jgi:hypothetical protein